jgi:hypothetical protein
MNWLIHRAKRVLRITGGAVLLIVGLILMFPGCRVRGFRWSFSGWAFWPLTSCGRAA